MRNQHLDAKIADYNTITSTAFGTGKTNTTTMKAKWEAQAYGSKNDGDMWSINMGDRFILSKDEWLVLGSNLKKKATGTYSSMTFPSGATLSMSNNYWSSSLLYTFFAYNTNFGSSYMSNDYVNVDGHVRLALTF